MIEQIDLDALRIAVRGHRRWQQVRLADQCGVSTEALHLFATGTALISASDAQTGRADPAGGAAMIETLTAVLEDEIAAQACDAPARARLSACLPMLAQALASWQVIGAMPWNGRS